MKLPLSWLKEYVDIKEPTNELVASLQSSGTKVESVININDDTIFDLEITPNRPDCLSVIGVAREIAAIYGRKIKLPDVFSTVINETRNRPVDINVDSNKLCPNYSVGLVESVSVGRSPNWMVERLEKSDVRSINNIVDITNYVMLETGQPMHAFDADKIKGRMVMRLSKKEEHITTLDGIERVLPKNTIIIEDEEKIIDLAGLMGGRNSEVDNKTKNVLLHAPLYDPLLIRTASQNLGLRTEASNRFEKKLDPVAHRFAFERALQLIGILAQGKLASPIKSIGYPTKEQYVIFKSSLVRDVLGIDINSESISQILTKLGFSISMKNEDGATVFKVGVPSFRTDINHPIDITEEIGRIYGYNNFPKTLPTGSPPEIDLSHENFEKKIKLILSNLGLKEIYSNSLTSASVLDNLGLEVENTLKVANRLVIDYEYLRPSLLVGLIIAASLNKEYFDRFSLYETGRVFKKNEGGDTLPDQPKYLSAIFYNTDFLQVKGALETLFNSLHIKGVGFDKNTKQKIFGENSATVKINEVTLGTIGDLKKEALAKFDIKAPVFAFEIDLDNLLNRISHPIYKPPPKFPTVKEDVSLFITKGTTFSQIENAIKQAVGNKLYNLELIEDIYLKNKRSLLIGLEYFHPNRTLTKEDTTSLRSKIYESLNSLDVTIRS